MFSSPLFSQVGIGNTSPKSTLDIEASNSINPQNTDGILIPRIDAFPSINPTEDQDGMLVFLTTNNIFYYWENTSEKWIPLYSDLTVVINGSGQHYIGELFGGGIVIYIYENGEHGIIASFDDLDGGTGAPWGLSGTDVTNCESTWDGDTNTQQIIAAGGLITDAAGLCNAYSITTSDGFFNDWHLPTTLEIRAFEEASYVIDKILNSDLDTSTNGIDLNERYWSSTELSSAKAKVYSFQNGHTENKNKTETYRVRAVRNF